jgi:hypothetical protein
MSPHHEGAKQDIIGVIGRTNAKLSHCMSLMLVYLMEIKMSLVHHAIER